MQIKLRGRLYDTTTEPIMIILSPQDKENIARMPPECDRYAVFPEGTTPMADSTIDWMTEPTPKARRQRKPRQLAKQ